MPRNGMNAGAGSGPAEVSGGAVGDLFWRMSQQHPVLARLFAWLGHGIGRATTAPVSLLLNARDRRREAGAVTINGPSDPTPAPEVAKAEATAVPEAAKEAGNKDRAAARAPLPPSEVRRQTSEALHRGKPDGPGPRRAATPRRTR